jgi:hypothetical protein
MLIIYVPFLTVLVLFHYLVYKLASLMFDEFYSESTVYVSKLYQEHVRQKIVVSRYKKLYITKNIWKSAMLALILAGTTIPVLQGFFLNEWTNTSFLFWGTLYVALDLSGLIYVRGLPKATVIHHIVVCILGTLNAMADYTVRGYYRSILIYTYFSIVPFIVNFYLGARYLIIEDRYRKLLAKTSAWIYTFSLGANIVSQVLFFATEPFSWTIVFYMSMYSLIMNDDVKLISFLWAEASFSV